MKTHNYLINITGIVQGVGFRPFIYNLAKSLSINGEVKNVDSAVVIECEGDKAALDEFVRQLKDDAPHLSRIKTISVQQQEYKGYTNFTITESSKSTNQNIYISPDVSICNDCRNELFNPNDRRFLYPFINCTNCGPRFTIIEDIPYDRVNTTMHKFTMCEKCATEYTNPADRRYHAQPVSCYECGPKLQLLDSEGNVIECDNIMKHTQQLLASGKIGAIKGLGGYHLVCNAMDSQAVVNLRRRKVRDDKPFALMVKDYETTLKYCYISPEERILLENDKKPIVLLKKREDCELQKEIAPGNPYLGIMLPYTPVHELLFYEQSLHTLVMTSGNKSSEPIFYKDQEALEGLCDIADFFLLNDREIYIRTDDSVTRVFRGKEYIIRRARGYVPLPVTCDFERNVAQIPSVLACGGELKNTFCLDKGNECYLSHHIGDLENTETLASFEEGIEHFKKLFDISYETVVHDLHPEYLSTKYAVSLDINKIAVQHHHAHIASCMAENNLNEDVIGVAFDGTGYGEDGNIWGGEFFTGGYRGFKRAGHLEYVRMPGGEMAIKEPWRMAVSYLWQGKLDMVSFLDVEDGKVRAILQMLERNINSPLTSSMGRLFDAISALLGVRSKINYEGQAAIELEYITEKGYNGEYGFIIQDGEVFNVCVVPMIEGIMKDIESGTPKGVIASKFHETVANIVLQGCNTISEKTGLKKVAMSGGVFQNVTLLEKCVSKLEEAGFGVYLHSIVPANDGGISLGQAAMAVARKFGDGS